MDDKVITIFGSGNADKKDSDFETALELGGRLAAAGFTIANGGYGGTMEAAAKGAAQENGEVIGVTCKAFGRSGPNKHITREIATNNLDERLAALIDLADAFVVLPGSTGTLLELAKIWEFKNKGFLKPDKPVILLGNFWKPLVALLAAKDSKAKKYLTMLDTPREVVNLLISVFKN